MKARLVTTKSVTRKMVCLVLNVVKGEPHWGAFEPRRGAARQRTGQCPDPEPYHAGPHDRRLSSRKLWIAFAQAAAGRVFVDEGAARALEREGSSLLAVGVVAVRGPFRTGDAVEIWAREGTLIAKGLARVDSKELAEILGKRDAPVVCHRDDLVVLSGGPGL